jgi:DNA modification methylase
VTEPKRQIQMVAIDELIPYARNSRTHDEAQIKQIEASLKEFGWTNPVLIDVKHGIVAGHGRVLAAKNLGYTEAPCIALDGLTDAQIRAYIIADNKIALNAGWDEKILSLELSELKLGGFNIDIIGFDRDELSDLFADSRTGLTDPDEIPALPEKEVSQEGDLWILGRHRLICGESRDEEIVGKLMAGQKADMIFTDPPYNVNYSGRGKKTSNTIQNDNLDLLEFQRFLTAAFKNYAVYAKAGAGMYVFHASRTQSQFENALLANGYEIKNQLIWNKPVAAMGWGNYRWKHEPFFYCGRKNGRTNFYGDRTKTTVWDFQKSEQELLAWAKKMKRLEAEGKTTIWTMSRDPMKEYVHPTQKPVELIKFALANSSKAEDIVLDLFGGSGSTTIACEAANRICYTMDNDPKYADVIITRWQNFTGQAARLESGQTFHEAKKERVQEELKNGTV